MTMHLLPERNRAIGFIFPVIIAVMAALIFPVFTGTGREWWPVFILAPAALVAVLIRIEFRATAIGFDTEGVHYRTVGYAVVAPWSGIKFHANGGKPILQVTQGQRCFFPWLGVMYKIVSIFLPFRANHVSAVMANIPLYFFLAPGHVDVMDDLRASAPKGML